MSNVIDFAAARRKIMAVRNPEGRVKRHLDQYPKGMAG